MKLKQRPDDFRVEEVTGVAPGEEGPFALYRLVKTGWTTPDALAAIRRRWKIDHRRLSYGGLKDRHAVTSQFLTILHGPKRNLAHERIEVTYLGQCPGPFTAVDILANRFAIVLRAMSDSALSHAVASLAEVEKCGLPNYFDDQRFGSVGHPPAFVAREMVLGRFEDALKLALAAPYEFDRADAKREKAILREHWGDWAVLKAKLPRGHARSLADYLVSHPADFRGAVARLRPELQGLYLSAYQSYLWNRILAVWLWRHFAAEALAEVQLKLGSFPAPRLVPEDKRSLWEGLSIPLPSARVKPDRGAAWLSAAEEVMKEEGLALAEMKIRGMQKPYFSKGERPACIRPANLGHKSEPDDLNAGKQKLLLAFDLPRGSYATMLVKRITSPRPGP
ncbi:MAG TPA: tRNA pseudouridine(13) synthase TruD [Gemmata sp.]|nr:tRNA pseudouridine(13) synthase TruD [Gemmata sp.]